MHPDQETLLRYMEDRLPAEARRKLEARLAEEAPLQDALDALRGLQGVLRASRAESFGPYFSERAMRRLQGDGHALGESFYRGLQWIFLRTATASFAAALAFAAYNAVTYQSLGAASSLLEAVFGLPSVSLADALSWSVM